MQCLWRDSFMKSSSFPCAGLRAGEGEVARGEGRRTLSRIVCCVHWPSGLIDSSLMEASVCCSGGVWGLWGRGGGFQQRGSALVEYRIRQIIPIGWVDMFIITPTLLACRAWAGCVAWEGAGGVGGWVGAKGGCGHEATLRFGQLACLGWGGRRRCCGV